MPIEKNVGKDFPGAASLIVPPVSEGECGNTPDFGDLVLHEEKDARGATIRSGKGWATRTLVQISEMCDLAVPALTTVTPENGDSPLERVIAGSDFGAEEWEVWASQSDTWASAVDKIAQVVVDWADTSITVTADVKCTGTGDWYLYVKNQAQLVNVSGRLFTVEVCN